MSIEPGAVKKIQFGDKTIYIKALSVRKFREVLAASESVKQNPTINSVAEAINVAESVVCGWEGFPMPFAEGAFAQVIQWEQALEMLGLFLSASTLSEDERKKFE